MNNLTGVIQLLKKEQDRLTRELRGISAALAAFGKSYGKGTGTGRLSASARARIAATQRARWAKVREKAKLVPIRAKRTLSAAARKKIAAAQKKRWAKQKAAKPVQVTRVPAKKQPEKKVRAVKKGTAQNALSSRSETVAAAAKS